jgi:membrane protein YdbS with pleckstrin-like domain
MSYLAKRLAPDEPVVFHTRLHAVVFSGALELAVVVTGVLGLLIRHNDLAPATVRQLCLAGTAIVVLGALPGWLRWWTSEFAVTSRRVMVKIGFVSVHTLELLLAEIESIAVDQSMLGRMLGYGTLKITGTGGTVEVFPQVSEPSALRDAVLAQVPPRGKQR